MKEKRRHFIEDTKWKIKNKNEYLNTNGFKIIKKKLKLQLMNMLNLR